MGSLKDFFSEEDKKRILSAIGEAESRTSGELRVHIEKKGGKKPMKTARKAFKKLGMRNTELHNGVLFFLAVEDHKFVILGDDGINQKVPDGFWDEVRDVVQQHFQNEQFAKGLAQGIKRAGEQLAAFFPLQRDDINELPDAISFGEEG